MNSVEDLIKILQENKDIIKSFAIDFSAPGILRGFNVEYFAPKMPTFPGGMICD